LPAAQTIYYEMGPVLRAQMGIAEGLIRLSIGIEDEEDLIHDFSQAFDLCQK
jgi:O-acetylhomoserine (thiol)-lyase